MCFNFNPFNVIDTHEKKEEQKPEEEHSSDGGLLVRDEALKDSQAEVRVESSLPSSDDSKQSDCLGGSVVDQLHAELPKVVSAEVVSDPGTNQDGSMSKIVEGSNEANDDANDIRESRLSSASNVPNSVKAVVELDKLKKDMKLMEAALHGAARQAQAKADAIARLPNENEHLKETKFSFRRVGLTGTCASAVAAATPTTDDRIRFCFSKLNFLWFRIRSIGALEDLTVLMAPRNKLPVARCIVAFVLIIVVSVADGNKIDRKVLNVGKELYRETLPLRMGSRLYKLEGLKPSAWYELKISYPASIPAIFSMVLKRDDSDVELNMHRKLLNTEKLIFKAESSNANTHQGGMYVLVTIEPEGIVAIPGVPEREVILFNIVCDELLLGIPHKAWLVVIFAVLCLLFAFIVPLYLPSYLLPKEEKTHGSSKHRWKST
ncbi:hypothetical protein Droror1_Dr00017154 [Drosera rotundifolia]